MASIEIVGSGVVGTATGLGLQEHGHDVTFLDSSNERVAVLTRQGLKSRNVSEQSDEMPDFTFVAVSAPTTREGVDLTNLRAATSRLARNLARTKGRWTTVVYRCTMPPGTMRKTLLPLLEAKSGLKAGVDFGIVYNPEYLRAVSAKEDFLSPRLMTVATLAKGDQSHAGAEKLLGTFGADVLWMPFEVAEFQKYVNNVGNAVKISTYNYFRNVGAELGLTEEEINYAFEASVQSAEGLWNPAYGTKNLGPYGGACLPKDTEALKIITRRMGMDVTFLETVQGINDGLLSEDQMAG